MSACKSSATLPITKTTLQLLDPVLFEPRRANKDSVYASSPSSPLIMSTSATGNSTRRGGWQAVFGCTYEALALFRVSLGVLLTCELLLRFRFLHVFYSDEGYVRPHTVGTFPAVARHGSFNIPRSFLLLFPRPP